MLIKLVNILSQGKGYKNTVGTSKRTRKYNKEPVRAEEYNN